MTRTTNHFFGALTAVLMAVSLAALILVAIAACGGQATTGHSLALLKDGTVAAWGANNVGQLGDGTTTDRPAPFQSRAVSGVASVAAGSYHSLAG